MSDTIFYYGCVENRMDPMKLGRCQVRVVGLHTEDKSILPTDDLPWAIPLVPITSATISGIGRSPTGIVQGSWVICVFMDEDKQQPIMIGTVGGIPQTATAAFISDATNDIVTTDETGELISGTGDTLTTVMDELLTAQQQISTMSSTPRYSVDVVSSLGTTNYYVTDKISGTRIASGYYDGSTSNIVMTLIKPENYSQNQYLPFTGLTGKIFNNTDEIAQYFEQNF